MELGNIIPNKSQDWVIRGSTLMIKKYEHIPIAFISNKIIYIYLDNKIRKNILKLVKFLINSNFKFYFTTPLASNPGYDDRYIINDTIRSYLYSYIQEQYHFGFKKIGFDIINNMVDWCAENNCIDNIKTVYDDLQKEVNRNYFDWNNIIFDYSESIREDYKSLYREIQINIIGI